MRIVLTLTFYILSFIPAFADGVTGALNEPTVIAIHGQTVNLPTAKNRHQTHNKAKAPLSASSPYGNDQANIAEKPPLSAVTQVIKGAPEHLAWEQFVVATTLLAGMYIAGR